MKISIIGSGYVGLVTGPCLDDFGLQVTCVDHGEQKINILKSGGVPIYAPHLEDLIKKNVLADRLIFTTDLEKAVKESKVIFITVGTPSNNDGSANLKQIETVAQQIARHLNGYKVIVNKSYDITIAFEYSTHTVVLYVFKHNESKTVLHECGWWLYF